MPKSKTQSAKVKKTATKYPKLLVVAEKELEDEKKALVLAERALQKAKHRHEELIANIARLDMLARSLKAFVDGTEPPTNVRYVYNYPQWVWAPTYTYPSYTTQPVWTTTPSIPSYPYTVTCQNSNLTGGAFSNLTGTYSDLTGAYNTTAPANLTTAVQSGSSFVCNTTTVGSLPAPGALTSGGQFSLGNLGNMPVPTDGITIDLSTNAEVVEPERMLRSAIPDVCLG